MGDGIALKRAALLPREYRRIIVVIPFLSIIEQNAEVYSRVFGPDAILEHHSGSFERLRKSADDEHFALPAEGEETGYRSGALRTATENWDAPLIVTTSVRFFESLFSNRPSDLRRVHNIARSIVILDEVQTLPRQLLAPLLSMISELATRWNYTFVFSTATQPAFERPPGANRKDSRWTPGTVREIVANPARLHAGLKRVTIEWELEQTISWKEMATGSRPLQRSLRGQPANLPAPCLTNSKLAPGPKEQPNASISLPGCAPRTGFESSGESRLASTGNSPAA